MYTFLIIIATITVTWYIAYSRFHNPQLQIEKYWKEILELSAQQGKWVSMGKDDFGIRMALSPITNKLITRKNQIGKVINALLELHYSNTEDEEEKQWVQENKYQES